MVVLVVICTDVARPSGAHGRDTVRAPTQMVVLGVHFGLGAPGHCPPCPPACYAPAYPTFITASQSTLQIYNGCNCCYLYLFVVCFYPLKFQASVQGVHTYLSHLNCVGLLGFLKQ